MRRRLIPLILAAFALLAPAGALAQAMDQAQPSLDKILPEIRAHRPGRFYDAEGPWRGPDGRMRYRLKWMTPDGRIVWFDADARTGRVLGPDYMRREDWPPPRRFRDDDRFAQPADHDRRERRERGDQGNFGGHHGNPHHHH